MSSVKLRNFPAFFSLAAYLCQKSEGANNHIISDLDHSHFSFVLTPLYVVAMANSYFCFTEAQPQKVTCPKSNGLRLQISAPSSVPPPKSQSVFLSHLATISLFSSLRMMWAQGLPGRTPCQPSSQSQASFPWA